MAINEQLLRGAIRKEQPPFFVRTNWLFAELDELALPEEIEPLIGIKIARLRGDVEMVRSFMKVITTNTEAMPDGREKHERRQLAAWIAEQIEREIV